jgi:hypothetical protein
MLHGVVPKNGNTPVLAANNLQRNESEPLLDHKNTRSAKHVEIQTTDERDKGAVAGVGGDGNGAIWRQRSTPQRKDRPSKDRHTKERSSGSRSSEPKRRPASQHSETETGSTEYSYSETGVDWTRW